jgi:hypothetical protein
MKVESKSLGPERRTEQAIRYGEDTGEGDRNARGEEGRGLIEGELRSTSRLESTTLSTRWSVGWWSLPGIGLYWFSSPAGDAAGGIRFRVKEVVLRK